ncbi:MAG: sigma-70 family RNA polymerase sigma factor [Nannocystaceae bacterium]|nr:sigma-70 family RNA polymerase sigma factor [Nannocystaceae bacterium]
MADTRNNHVDAFLDRLAPSQRAVYAAMPNLGDLLGDMLAQALASWPQISLSAEEFLAHVAARLPAELAPEEALGGLFVADLFLACACAKADRRALEAFEHDFAGEIARGLTSLAGDEVRGDDFKQEVRHKLFIGKPPAGPKIGEYSGRGSLRRWVRITAKRTYIDLMRSKQREPEVLAGDEAVSERASEQDPELVYVKERYRQEFRTAFTTALSTLTTRQRNILRHHFVHRLRFDEIAGIYRVHRATIARWIADARAALLERTRAALREQLAVEGAEFDSIMRLVTSDMDVTVSRLLKPPGP